jgi:hypothetical protein
LLKDGIEKVGLSATSGEILYGQGEQKKTSSSCESRFSCGASSQHSSPVHDVIKSKIGRSVEYEKRYTYKA